MAFPCRPLPLPLYDRRHYYVAQHADGEADARALELEVRDARGLHRDASQPWHQHPIVECEGDEHGDV